MPNSLSFFHMSSIQSDQGIHKKLSCQIKVEKDGCHFYDISAY